MIGGGKYGRNLPRPDNRKRLAAGSGYPETEWLMVGGKPKAQPATRNPGAAVSPFGLLANSLTTLLFGLARIRPIRV